MEKNLQEYRHLYHQLELIDGKLPLRKLSDITEEEMREVVLINYAVKNTLLSVVYNDFGIDFKTCGFAGDKYIDFNRTNAETIAYLLSKGLDIFHLIESGLALDKTKQLAK